MTKRAARRSGIQAEETVTESQCNGIEEPFPRILLETLHKLATETQTSAQTSAQTSTDDGKASSSKRRRLQLIESIPVLHEAFTVSRPSKQKDLAASRITCEDASSYFTFSLDQDGLVIRSKASARCDLFYSTLYLDHDLSEATQAAVAVLSHSREDKTEEGALTALATITVQEKDGMHHMSFSFDINWNPAVHTLRNTRQRNLSERVLKVLENNEPEPFLADDNAPLKSQAFYEAAFIPNQDDFKDLRNVSIPGLDTSLYPFQRRALQWLLMKEGVKYSNADLGGELQLAAYDWAPGSDLPLSFRPLSDAKGRPYYVSDLYHIVTRDVTPFQESENTLRGGILAEEMGLGKTVEMISLILAHRRDNTPSEADAHDGEQGHATGATLIVTPDTLQNQWISEFKKHAPQLLVLKYPGMKVWSRDKMFNEERWNGNLTSKFASKLATCDVVITTYNVLQAEIHYARPAPERAMRYERQHERYTSPLVELNWWRVCLDEAQQIDSGVSSAATVARSIPRVNAWAVTGTPVKDDLNDLWGLLLFLRYEPFASLPFVWKALLNTHPTLFSPLFSKLSLRHSKRAVRDELKLPSQSRYVVTMPFTSIERHHYQSQLKALLAKAGLSEEGIPLAAGWDPDNPSVIDSMKKALANLRQTILHPELGSVNTRVAVYRTLTEHLDAMIERSDADIRTAQRNYWNGKTTRGQLLDNTPRVRDALPVWEEVLVEMEPSIRDARNELQAALELARQERARKEQEKSANSTIAAEKIEDEEALETTKVGECRRKLRMLLEAEHRARFLIASALYQIKSNEDMTIPNSDEYKQLEQREVEGYELAKALRREILQDPLTKASRLMDKLKTLADAQSFVEIPEIITLDLRGIESGNIVDDLESLGASLNDQADVIDDWREHVIQLLLKPLVDAEKADEVTGDEYEDSTKVQDHLMVYTQALRAVIGDRQEALGGLANERISHEIIIAERMARAGEGHAPELLLELLQLRQDVKLAPPGASLRGIIASLRVLSTKLRHDASGGNNRARLELEVVTTHLRATQDLLNKQSKAVLSLERDLDFFTSAMNARVDFYRQLQTISDNLAPIDIGYNQRERTWYESLEKERTQKQGISFLEANHRHLLHIKEEDTSARDPCNICLQDFIEGTITTCGHTFCKECIVSWLRSKHRCPLCRVHQTVGMLSEFQRNQPALKIRQGPLNEPHHPLSQERSRRTGIYSDFSEAKLRAIQNIKLEGPSYSTKVDTLIKHLLWLREEDPGAKSIIFSQFRAFLSILHQALVRHRIGCAAFTQSSNKAYEIQRFRDDPGTECLLMDAKSHSSGLNLVNASHVFLCEPLLNTALELQAIARVDRIGQEHKTTVWLYLAEETVEENIYALSERRRLAHIGDVANPNTNELEAAVLEAANSRELEQAGSANLMSKSEEGEAVDKGDVWECLFGTVSV